MPSGRLPNVPPRGRGARPPARTLTCMDIILFGLAALAVTAVAGPVALVSAGIRQQERASSLTSQPSGLLALLAARTLGLRTCLPASGQPSGSGARPPARGPPPGRQPRLRCRTGAVMTTIWLIAVAGLVLTAIKWAFFPGRRLPRHRVGTCGSGSGSACTPARAWPP